MKTNTLNFWLLTAVALFIAPTVNAQVGSLIWEDNFDNFNPDIWNVDNGNGCEIGLCGWGNAELQYYRNENLSIESIPGEAGNNALVMEAKREGINGFEFTSGKVTSEGKLSIHYGMIEIRMQTPSVETGLWPAAWLLGTANVSWPAKGEIDMMEMGHRSAEIAHQGHEGVPQDNYVGANAIFANTDGSVGSIAYDVGYNKPYVAPTSMANRFVTYRLYWEPTELRLTVIDNGVESDLYEGPLPLSSDSVTSAFQKPFFLLMNLAVGGNFTDAAIPSEVTANLSSKLYIDYVKVYEWNGFGEVAFNYDELAVESGPFGVFTEETPTNNNLSIGLDSDVYVWGGTMQNGTTTAYEGEEVITWETLNPNGWFGGGVASTFGRDMSGYVDNGVLKFNLKVPADLGFRIGITDNFTNESWIPFAANESKYGLVRNGEWSQIEIPIVDFAGLVAFQNMNYMFAISSIDGSFPTSSVQIGIDNIIWDDGKPLVSEVKVTEVTLSQETAKLFVDETVVFSALVSPGDATNTMVNWSSSNTSIATVDNNGLVTAIGVGTANITATTIDGEFTDMIALTVADLITDFETKIEAEDYVDMFGVLTENTTDLNGGENVGWIATGDWMEYKIDVPSAGNYNLNLRVSSLNQGGNMDITANGNFVDNISFNATGGWQTWTTISANLNLSAGEQVIRLTATSPSWNINWLEVSNSNNSVNNEEDTELSVNFGNLYDGDSYNVGESLYVLVNATSNFSNISNVKLYVNDELVRQENIAPYEWGSTGQNDALLTNLAQGVYAIKAIVTDVDGNTEADTITINVGNQINVTPYTNIIQAENYTSMSGVLTETTTDDDGGINVGWIDANDWVSYEVEIPTTGEYTISYRVASLNNGGDFILTSDEIVLDNTVFASTSGWQNWNTISSTVNLSAGNQTLRLTANTGGWNINWIEISNNNQASTITNVSRSVLVQSNQVNISPLGLVNVTAIEVLDVTGAILLKSNNANINTNLLSPGVYILRILLSDGTTEVKRIVK